MISYLVESEDLFVLYIDGLVQDCSNSIANALELLQSCTKLSIFNKSMDGIDLIIWINARSVNTQRRVQKAVILMTARWNAFSRKNYLITWLKIYWCWFQMVKLTIIQRGVLAIRFTMVSGSRQPFFVVGGFVFACR